MFNEKLFYEICERYNVEIKEGKGKPQVYDDGVLRDLTEQDIREMFGKENKVMEDGKIIGFNLNLYFGFENNIEYKEVINKVENVISDYFCNKQHDTGAILLNGKAEFIRENNDLGIKT